jgi:hypothetical protein
MKPFKDLCDSTDNSRELSQCIDSIHLCETALEGFEAALQYSMANNKSVYQLLLKTFAEICSTMPCTVVSVFVFLEMLCGYGINNQAATMQINHRKSTIL